MATAQDRIYRTTDGAPVLEGDPRAVALAYVVGDEVPDAILDELAAAPAAESDQGETAVDEPAEVKQADKPENKSRTRRA